jgi:protein TonB
MNKRMTGMAFGSAILIYSFVMTISYTSCNSDSSGDKVASSPATDSSNMSTDSATKMSATKKVKKGKASIAMAAPGTKIMKDKSGIYTQPEKMPEYPGGESALSQYVENHLDYPQQALNDNKEGTVRVSFIVDENGKVSNPMVVGNKVGDGLDEEAIRVINSMPNWKPGMVKGKTVKTRLDLPITFQVATES